eukprot:SAG11_NODE_51_length_19848_cov_37.780698_2_plen_155_part_00
MPEIEEVQDTDPVPNVRGPQGDGNRPRSRRGVAPLARRGAGSRWCGARTQWGGGESQVGAAPRSPSALQSQRARDSQRCAAGRRASPRWAAAVGRTAEDVAAGLYSGRDQHAVDELEGQRWGGVGVAGGAHVTRAGPAAGLRRRGGGPRRGRSG